MAHTARVDRLRPGDPDRVGPYRLTGRIGAGGMGVVYAGHRPGAPQDLVAVKVIKEREGDGRSGGADPDRAARLRFAQEAVLIQRVDAACTPTIFETGLYGRQPWMAMEYVTGQTLFRHVRTYGALSVEQLLSFGLGTAEALSAIHQAGVVHLDLKPANIILGESGPRVLDFGLARALNIDPLHEDRGLFGTPGYISPERVHGPVGPPADVFAWGAVMAFAATGANPFGPAPSGGPREKAETLLERAREGRADLRRVPEAVRGIVGRALSPRPERRPDAAELFEFFAGTLDETTTVVPGDSTRELTSRLLDQNWRITGDGGADRPGREPVRGPRRGVATKPRRRSGANALVFAHRSFTDPGRLATAMASRPAEAETWLRDGGAARLTAWLTGREGAEAVSGELETAGSGGTAAQRAVTVFAAVFRPTATPRYRGVPVDADGLAELARRGPRGADRAVLAEVFDHGVVAALGRCGHTRLKQLASGVPKLTEAAVDRLTHAGRTVDEEHRRRARELAVLSLLGEEPRWSRPDGAAAREQGWRRLRADARRGGGRPAALIALALYPSTEPRPGTRERSTARSAAPSRNVPVLFAPPRQLRATLRPRALLALASYTVWQVLALAVGMVSRTIGEPYVYATASRVGREFGAAAAERAADLFLVLLVVALGVVVLRVEALRWVSAAGALAAVLLALPQAPFPGVWAPGWLRLVLHGTATVWGSAVALGGLLGCVGATVGVLRLWRAMPRAGGPRRGLSERTR